MSEIPDKISSKKRNIYGFLRIINEIRVIYVCSMAKKDKTNTSNMDFKQENK